MDEVKLDLEEIKKWRKTSRVKNYVCDYDPEFFWNELGESYIDDFLTDGLVNENCAINLQVLIPRINYIKPESILEVGCGFGRCIAFIVGHCKELKEITGVDISKTMLNRCNEFFDAYDKSIITAQMLERRNIIKMIQANSNNLPFKDKSFDLSFTHVVLTHIPPSNVEKSIDEIVRVTKSWIIHLERYVFDYEHPNTHRWSHSIAKIYQKYDFELWECCRTNKEHDTVLYVFRNKS